MGKLVISVQFMSDLHLERHKYNFAAVRTAPTLILGGDIGRFNDYDHYRGLLTQLCDQFELVILVAGNHEFYGTTRAEGLAAAERLTNEPSMGGKLRFLNQKDNRIDLNSNITVLGCTLHSKITSESRLTNDFKRIQEWTVAKHNEQHNGDLECLEESLRAIQEREPDRQIIIVTHYAPVFERVCHPKNELNDVSQCFSSNALEHLRKAGLLQSVSHWIFGHTHWNTNIKVGGLRLISNQMQNDDRDLSWWQKKRLHIPFDPRAHLSLKVPSG